MAVLPEKGQVGWGADSVDLHVVFVVSLVTISGFTDKAEPDTPLVLESVIHHLVHQIIKKRLNYHFSIKYYSLSPASQNPTPNLPHPTLSQVTSPPSAHR